MLYADSQMSVKLFQTTPSCGRIRGLDTELAAYHSAALSFLYPLPPDARCSDCSVERPRVIVFCRTCKIPV